MISRRIIMGLAGAAIAAPKTTARALVASLQAKDPSGPSRLGGFGGRGPIPQGWDRTLDSENNHFERLRDGGLRFMDLLETVDKGLLALRRDELDALSAKIRRRRYHRRFAYSMSEAAKRAYDHEDDAALKRASGSLADFMADLRKRYAPMLAENPGAEKESYSLAEDDHVQRADARRAW